MCWDRSKPSQEREMRMLVLLAPQIELYKVQGISNTNWGGGRLIFGYLYKIFGFWTYIRVLDKIPWFGTKYLGPWTNPWGLDKIEIKLFKLRGVYRLKMENLASLSSLKVPHEPECVFRFVFIAGKFLKKLLRRIFFSRQKIYKIYMKRRQIIQIIAWRFLKKVY